jgi:hypothetical protein
MTEPPDDELPDDVPPMLPFPSSRLIGAAAPGAQHANSSPKRPRRARAKRSGRRANLDTAGEVGGLLLLAIGAIIGGILLHAQFAPKDALCNTVGGSMAQQQSTGAMAHCGLYGFLSGMGEIVRWGGTLGFIFCLIALWVVRSGEK